MLKASRPCRRAARPAALDERSGRRVAPEPPPDWLKPMDFAALRRCAAPGRAPDGRLSPRQRRASDTPLPSYVSTLFNLTHIAVGDADSAAVLVADVLLAAPQHLGAAVRRLVALLPPDWLSWPNDAGPAEWLGMRLRYEQATRLISILGVWTPRERLALALYLLEEVRRDDLDAWLGTTGMAERLSALISSAGASLGQVPPPGESHDCREVAADLLDVDDSQLGARARLHTIGCAACRAHAAGLRRTRVILRRALDVLFRADVPPHFPRLIAERRIVASYPRTRVRLVALLSVMLLLWSAVARGAEPAQPPAAPPPPLDGPRLIDLAIHRFDDPVRSEGILHERFQIGNGPYPLTIERWFDYRPPHRLRVTVSRRDRAAPLFDLVASGPDRLAYILDPGVVRSYGGATRDPLIAAYIPMLAQLPAIGSLGALPVPQHHLDVPLLAEARRGAPTLLGSVLWRDRPAYLVASTTHTGERLVLTIDRESLSLLEARLMAAAASASTTFRVWEADLVEILLPRDVPASRFYLQQPTEVAQINPRQLFRYPLAELDLPAASRIAIIAVPDALPEPPLIAFIRNRSGLRTPVYQVYEGRWSTLLVLSPAIIHAPPRPLERRFPGGAYTLIDSRLPQTTLAEFALDAAPGRRMRVYFWHMLAADAEREALVERVIRSMVLIEATTIDRYAERFAPPPPRPWTLRRRNG